MVIILTLLVTFLLLLNIQICQGDFNFETKIKFFYLSKIFENNNNIWIRGGNLFNVWHLIYIWNFITKHTLNLFKIPLKIVCIKKLLW